MSLGIASKSVSPLLDDSEDVDGAAGFWLHSLQCEGKYGRNSGHLEATCGTLEFCEGFYKCLWAPKKEFYSVGNFSQAWPRTNLQVLNWLPQLQVNVLLHDY